MAVGGSHGLCVICTLRLPAEAQMSSRLIVIDFSYQDDIVLNR